MTLPLKVLGDRVLVVPDVNRHAPTTTESGILVAATLAAAVTGEDPERSVHRGTVVAVGNPRHPKAEEVQTMALQVVDDFPETGPVIAELLNSLVAREPCCAVGDDVLFGSDAGQLMTIENETYLILREADLIGIVEPEVVHG